jgi:hypothetical protein
MGVSVGVGRIEIGVWTANVGVKVGKGVRVGRICASSDDPNRGSDEQARLIKISKVIEILKLRGR